MKNIFDSNKTPGWLWNVRVCNWPIYSKGNEGDKRNLGLTVPEARNIAKDLKEKGVNFVNASFSFHFRFNFVDIFDQIKEMTKIIADACHQHGIKVYEHHSATLVTKMGIHYKGWNIDNWTNVDLRTGNATIFGDYHCLCINNPNFKAAYFDYITDFIKYTGVDGLMHDDIQFALGWFHCGCKYCRKKFKKIFGYNLPTGKNLSVWEDFSNAIWRDWIQFRIISTGDELVDISKIIGKNKALFACCSVGSTGTLDAHDAGYTYESFARGANVLFLETMLLSRNIPYGERKYYYDWKKLALEKKYYSGMSYHFNMPVIDLHYPHSTEEDIFCWILTKSFGHNLWRGAEYGQSADNPDQPGYEYFNWETNNANLFRYPKPYANIAILFSSQNKILLGESPDCYINEWGGWCRAMIEENIPFEVILDQDLCDVANLNRYKLLILPNAACLSAKQVKTIEKFVETGGNLILTHESSLYDETGKKMGNFALSDLMGLAYRKTITESNRAIFIDPQRKEAELLKGLNGRLPCHTTQVLVNPKNKNLTCYAWIERYNVFSYETEYPAIVETKDSNPKKGRVLYFGAKIGLLNHTEGTYSYGGINYSGEKINVKEDSRKKKAYWAFIRNSTPDEQRIFWLDESLPEYKMLIVNSVRYLIGKKITLKTKNVPQGIFINIYRLGRGFLNKERGKGDIVIHMVNVMGTKLSSGEIIPEKPNVTYPSLANYQPGGKKIILEVLSAGIKNAYLVSPDFAGQKQLKTIQKGSYCVIEISPSLIDKYSVVHLRKQFWKKT